MDGALAVRWSVQRASRRWSRWFLLCGRLVRGTGRSTGYGGRDYARQATGDWHQEAVASHLWPVARGPSPSSTPVPPPPTPPPYSHYPALARLAGRAATH